MIHRRKREFVIAIADAVDVAATDFVAVVARPIAIVVPSNHIVASLKALRLSNMRHLAYLTVEIANFDDFDSYVVS